ncbi:MAG: sigma factor-like helix-turn-helix DNA-binding protein [Clostridia bacterium]|nr:sigma factor-like helix-turn-helix DNA-binding protein [Clostridia bacterium]
MLDILKTTLLYDFYGELLTDKQKEIYELFYQNDMSLTEIGAELGISRQAVRDQLKRTEKILSEYEDKLRLVERFMANKSSAGRIRKLIDELERTSELSENSLSIAEQIREAVDEITE